MRWTLSVLLGLLLFVGVGPAWGQNAREPRRVMLRIQATEPNVDLELWNTRRTELLGRCGNTCQLDLPVGKYQLLVYQQGRLVARRRMSLRYPARWKVQPPEQEARNNWLTVGVAGTVIFTAGTLILGYAALQSYADQSADTCATIGLVGMGAGLLIAPLGWVMYGQNSLRVHSEALSPEQQRSLRPRAAPGLRLSFSF